MANLYYISISLIAVVVLSSVICVLADGIDGESPLAKRRRLSIEKLRNTGRLRRIFKKRFDENEFQGVDDEDELISPTDFLDFLDELEALERLKENKIEYEKRGNARREGSRKMNGWYTGMFGKRSSAASIRETRNIPQTYLSGDYFGKRFSDESPAEGLDWKRTYNLEGMCKNNNIFIDK